MRLRKHRSRKKKRKLKSTGGPVTQAKKKSRGNAASTSRAPDAGNVKFDEGNFVIPSLDDQNHEDGDRSRMGDIDNNKVLEQGNQNGSVVFPPQVEERENHNEMDANLVESTDAPFPNEGRNRLPVDNLVSEASELICLANGDPKFSGEGLLQAGGLEDRYPKVGGKEIVLANGLENGQLKLGQEGAVIARVLENGHGMVDGQEAAQGDIFGNGHGMVDGEGVMQAGARLGSRKRKPSLVKRFNQEKNPCITNYASPDLMTKNTRSGGMVAQNHDHNSVHRSNDLGCKSKSDDITDASSITEIIKPLSFSSSESAPDILVTFMAKRFVIQLQCS